MSRRDQGLEEREAGVPLEFFGMPLHTHDEVRTRLLDCLDQAVGAARTHDQAIARRRDGLVVEAIDRGVRPQDSFESAAGRDRYCMASVGFGKRVLQRTRNVDRNVMVQAAAVMLGDQLHSVANAQDGDFSLEGTRQQLLVELPLRLRGGVEADLGGVLRRLGFR